MLASREEITVALCKKKIMYIMYIFISGDQNAGENRNMKIGKGSSKGVAEFKYFGNNLNEIKIAFLKLLTL